MWGVHSAMGDARSSISLQVQFRGLRRGKFAKGMKKNAKLAPLQTSLRQVAIFLHNADFPSLRVTKPPSNSPAERCCFALAIGCVGKKEKFVGRNWAEPISSWGIASNTGVLKRVLMHVELVI